MKKNNVFGFLRVVLLILLIAALSIPVQFALAIPAAVTTNYVVTSASADWAFLNDNGTIGDWTTGFQIGPATAPLGAGSISISLNSAAAGIVFGTQKYQGTRLADIQTLSYSTYTNLSPAAMSFQINYDPDVTTIEAATWYGRLIYEPYRSGTVTNGTWQTWDMLNGGAGVWWASGNANSPVDNSCPQASPCTLTALLAAYPNIGIRNDANSFIQVKAGSNWNGFVGNADNLTIQIAGNTDIYDFEPILPTATPTSTSTETSTPTMTSTATSTETSTPTVTRTVTSTKTSTSTATATSTETVTVTPTATVTMTETLKATTTLTNTLTLTSTVTKTQTNTQTVTATRTPTATRTVTRTATLVPVSVTINQAASQLDPTSSSPIHFTAIFSEGVTGFTGADIDFTGTTLTGTLVATVAEISPNNGTTYDVAITGMLPKGTVFVRIPANAVNSISRPTATNKASTSTDRDVTFDYVLVEFGSTASKDGWLLESTETSGVGGSKNAGANSLTLGDDASNRQYRSLVNFDTASLPDNAVIYSVNFRIIQSGVVGTNPFATHGALRTEIRTGFFGTSGALEIADFKAPISKIACNFEPVPEIIEALGPAYRCIVLATAYPYISRTSTTQLRMRFMTDDNNDLSADTFNFYSGNFTNISQRPRLFIKYYIPPTP